MKYEHSEYEWGEIKPSGFDCVVSGNETYLYGYGWAVLAQIDDRGNVESAVVLDGDTVVLSLDSFTFRSFQMIMGMIAGEQLRSAVNHQRKEVE